MPSAEHRDWHLNAHYKEIFVNLQHLTFLNNGYFDAAGRIFDRQRAFTQLDTFCQSNDYYEVSMLVNKSL